MFETVGRARDAIAKLVAFEGPIDLEELNVMRNQLESVWLRTVNEYDRSGQWCDEGFVSAPAGIRNKCRIDQGVASSTLGLARKLRDLPAIAERLASGEISRAHAVALATPHTPGRPEYADFVEPLTELAAHTTPKGVSEKIREITDALDGDGGGDRSYEAYLRRKFHMSQTMDGMWRGDFLLDPEAGRMVKTALGTIGGVQSKDDDRTAAQFRADGFLDLCRAGMRKGKTGRGAHRPRADITVHVDLSEIEQRSSEIAMEIREHAGHGLSRSTLDRLCCDANFARVITDGPSQVLDVGRATREWPTAMRRAIEARDGGCTHPGCDRGPEHCDIHHIVAVEDGGETSVENGKLECRHHHVLEHEGNRGPPYGVR
jgi:hypothetical protein